MNRYEKYLYFAVACLALAGLCGCADGVRSHVSDGPPSAGDILAESGAWIIRLGLAAIGAGVLCKVLGRIPATATWALPFSAIADEAIILGVASIGMGSCVVFIGIHSWVIYVTSAACVVVYLVRHRALLASWLGIGQTRSENSPT